VASGQKGMSFLRSIGELMAGSGLTDVFECCYGPNTVKHMISGKAVARAIVIESALAMAIILLKSVMNTESFESRMGTVRELYDSIVSTGFDIDSQEFPGNLCVVEEALNKMKNEVSERSHTGKLWILYLHYVSVLKQLIRAERTADWHLHLANLAKMINLFAATGHNNYAKCVRLYVERMSDLLATHPSLYQQFVLGNHVARHSNKLWTGLPTDLMIEQYLMRALKSKGGLTHGRGINESVWTTWISSVHKSASIQSVIAKLAGLEYCHDEMQHPEWGKVRTRRDNADLQKLLTF